MRIEELWKPELGIPLLCLGMWFAAFIGFWSIARISKRQSPVPGNGASIVRE